MKDSRPRRLTWSIARVGDVCEVRGGGTPSRARPEYYTGSIPWLTVKDLIEGEYYVTDATEHITIAAVQQTATRMVPVGAVIVATRVGLGKVAQNLVPVAINQDLKALLPDWRIHPLYLLRFLAYYMPNLVRLGRGSTVKGILQSDLLGISLPLPPILVQRRIVEILSKADDIRRKRTTASTYIEALYGALFVESFGDPATNPHGLPITHLGTLIAAGPQNGLYKHRSLYGSGTPIVRINNFYGGVLGNPDSFLRVRLNDVEIDRYKLQPGDILINRVNSLPYVGKCALVPRLPEPTVFESNMMRLRLDSSRVLPEYVVAFLCTSAARHQIRLKARGAVNQVSINQEDVRSLQLLLPSMDDQREFLERLKRVERIHVAAQVSRSWLDALLANLSMKAFTGELTADWERENAEEIAAYQRVHEELPRLVLVGLLHAAEREAGRRAVLLTALMKYAFVFQMQNRARQRLYAFRPYKYGPFASEIYDHLGVLEAEGLIHQREGGRRGAREWHRIELTQKGRAYAEELLPAFDPDLVDDIAEVARQYAPLDHDALLDRVYDEYPEFARKSVRKKGAATKRASTKGRRS